MSAEIQAVVRQHLDDEFMFMRPDLVLDDQLDLLGEGILDSIGILRVTAFIEDAFSVVLGPSDLISENFRDLGTIVAVIVAASSRGQADRPAES
ncbi:hypothetical protein [Enhygromyxa salina]|uniref:Carrier domain-containing protein n=1 Tax=Enhygromyxa salina TaxID=215803 RepID=A0A2S9YN31_9BACT|nr:hypothetical protein [Enhygromyxa salina]PRQ06484.1 hypothetical protein ENSA7_38030 [Enhygromyxa salina]